MKQPTARATKSARPLPYHPFLFAPIPVISLYSQNQHLLAPIDILQPTLYALGAAGVLFLVLAALTRDRFRAAATASWIVLSFFFYAWLDTAIVLTANVSPFTSFALAALFSPALLAPGAQPEYLRAPPCERRRLRGALGSARQSLFGSSTWASPASTWETDPLPPAPPRPSGCDRPHSLITRDTGEHVQARIRARQRPFLAASARASTSPAAAFAYGRRSCRSRRA